jgi:hypothetical protein
MIFNLLVFYRKCLVLTALKTIPVFIRKYDCQSKFNLAKFSDFAKLTNDFFGKEFPAGQVRVEVKSTAKPSAGAQTSFTDVIKLKMFFGAYCVL